MCARALLILPLITLSHHATAQTPAPAPAATMQKFPGVWIEGPGFEINYGASYEACSQLCLKTPSCMMIEYYRPEKKCNLYNTVRPRLKGGSSDVAIRK
jgi:PAN domain